MTDLYSVLGVMPDASQDEITDAYYRRLRFDDIGGEEARARSKELREAYEVLRDPALRRSYDTSQGIWQPEAPLFTPRIAPSATPSTVRGLGR